jgi:hypothetical protein
MLTDSATQSAGEKDTPKQKNNADQFTIRKSLGIQQLLTPELTSTPASSSLTPVSTLSDDIPPPPDLPEEELDGERPNVFSKIHG